MRTGPPTARLDLQLSRSTRNLLVALFALFVAQLLATNWLHLPVLETLAWWSIDTGLFRPWQPLSAWLLNGPAPFSAFLDWLMVFFFLAPVEDALGRRGLVRATLLTVVLGALSGVVLDLVGAVGGPEPFLGLNSFITMLVALFGFTRPNAQILLFFVLPVRAGWIAWGTGLLAFLYFLATRSLESTLWLAGFAGGWLYLEGRSGRLRRQWLRLRQRQVQKKLQRFEVIEGEGLGSPKRPPGWGRSSEEDDTVH